jgi:hypothetical protein
VLSLRDAFADISQCQSDLDSTPRRARGRRAYLRVDDSQFPFEFGKFSTLRYGFRRPLARDVNNFQEPEIP